MNALTLGNMKTFRHSIVTSCSHFVQVAKYMLKQLTLISTMFNLLSQLCCKYFTSAHNQQYVYHMKRFHLRLCITFVCAMAMF